MRHIKNYKYLAFITLIAVFTLSVYQCEKPKSSENAITKLVVTADKDYQGNINGKEITFSESLPFNTTVVTIKTLEISPKADADTNVGRVLQAGGDDIVITAENGDMKIYSVRFTFKRPLAVPTVLHANGTPFLTSVTLSGNITNFGGDDISITEHGHIWSTTSGNLTTTLSTKTNLGKASNTGGFQSNATGLSKNTTYYYVAYATNSVGIGYSIICNIKTKNDETTIKSMTLAVSGTNFTQTQNNISGTNIVFSNLPYGTTQAQISELSLADQATATIGSNAFTKNSVLSVGSNSIVVTASNGTSQTYTITLTTEPDTPPTLTTLSANPVAYTTATLKGRIDTTGNNPVQSYGFVYSTNSSSLTLSGEGTTVQVGSTINAGESFSKNLTGLSDNTLYYVVAYATNNAGTVYGTPLSFRTIEATPPTVRFSISINTLSGTITNFGGATVTSFGFVWSESGSTPTISSNVGIATTTQNINADGHNFTFTLTGGMYDIRAFATNKKGTSYSDSVNYIAYINIPDEHFRNAIISCINNGHTRVNNTNHQCNETYEGNAVSSVNSIRQDVLETITFFEYNGSDHNNDLRNLGGVEFMTALTRLQVNNNSLGQLDLTTNTSLSFVEAYNNDIKQLNVSTNTALIFLNTYNNSLTNLILNPNTSLTSIVLYDNSLTHIGLSTNTALESLYLYDNSLTHLDVSTNTELTLIVLNDNSSLTYLNLSNLTELNKLYLYRNNNLTELNISDNTSLTFLDVEGTSLTALDVSNNTLLSDLDVTNNLSLTCIQTASGQTIGTLYSDYYQSLSNDCGY